MNNIFAKAKKKEEADMMQIRNEGGDADGKYGYNSLPEATATGQTGGLNPSELSESGGTPQVVDKSKDQARARQARMVLLGGVFIQLFNGVFFVWSNIAIYVLSWQYQYDHSVRDDSIFAVDIALMFCNVTGYQIGTYLLEQRKWNPKMILAIGSTIALTGIFTSSFATSFPLFIVLYGVMSGIGCGINYMIPLVIGWQWYPESKGWVTGVVISAYGFSSFMFTNLSTVIINPNAEQATIFIDDDLSYFRPEVANRVPLMLWIMSSVFLVLVLMGIALIKRPPEDSGATGPSAAQEEQEDNRPISELDSDEKVADLKSLFCALRSWRFWQYAGLLYFGTMFSTTFAYEYKAIGLSKEAGMSDQLLTWAGSLSAIVQCVTRLATGWAYDKLGFKKIYTVVLVVTLINSVVCYNVRKIHWLYFICVMITFFCFAATFAVFPAPCAKTFGPKYGAQVYAMVVFGACFTSLSNYIIVKVLKDQIGFYGIFGIGSGFTMLAIFIVICIQEKLDIHRMEAMGLIVWKRIKKSKQDVEAVTEASKVEDDRFEGGDEMLESQEGFVDMKSKKNEIEERVHYPYITLRC